MNSLYYRFDLISLNQLLIEKNKVFTESLKEGRNHSELVNIYGEIREIYDEICSRKKTPPPIELFA